MNNVSFGGTTVVSSGGQNVSMINGKVFVNGQEVTSSGQTKPRRMPKLRITAPTSDLEATLSGCSLIASTVPIRDTYLSLSGSTKAGIPTRSLELDTSGSSKVRAILGGGDLSIDSSGSASIDIEGRWSRTKISVSGMGNVVTRGECIGNYSVSASGMGSVAHVGSISGNIRKHVSGMARINL